MNSNESIRVLVRDTITEVAPDESVLVSDYSPNTQLYGSTAQGPQGFGASIEIALVLPYVWQFFSRFFERLSTNLADEAGKAIKDWLADNTENSNDSVPELIKRELIQTGLPEKDIKRTSEAIIKALRKNAGLVLAHNK